MRRGKNRRAILRIRRASSLLQELDKIARGLSIFLCSATFAFIIYFFFFMY